MSLRLLLPSITVASIALGASVAAGPRRGGLPTCEPGFLEIEGPQPYLYHVRALASVGGTLYVGGQISSDPFTPQTYRVTGWDGSRFSPLGGAVNDRINALVGFDAGGGEELYAGGEFLSLGGVAASRVARWNGTDWEALGSGPNGKVWAMTVFDFGAGPRLVVGGDFAGAGGSAASRVARWDGTSWTGLGGGDLDLGVRALAVHDGGTGPSLYAGGLFTSVGGAPVAHVARWDGASWAALGSGVDDVVWALASFDDGGGPALYAGGEFTSAGGAPAGRIARWDGTSWSPLGSGAGTSPSHSVRSLAGYDDGDGSKLYVGGEFFSAGGVSSENLARWDGVVWDSIGSVNGVVHALVVHDDGSGPALQVGGTIGEADGVALRHSVARWNGGWSTYWQGLNRFVRALRVHDAGAGPALFVAGEFEAADGTLAQHVAAWDGATWSALGSGIDGRVNALASFDGGGGPTLCAGGDFSTAGGMPAERVAAWDGTSWSPLGGGLAPTFSAAYAMLVHDGGGGPALHVGGRFDAAGGVPCGNLARWDGASWSALGAGLDNTVLSLCAYDDGSGFALYAGGLFQFAGDIPAVHVARWDGTSWTGLGAGVGEGDVQARVNALAVWDDGSGPALYAGGRFSSAGGMFSRNVARWDGTSWSAVGSFPFNDVNSLQAFDDGTGPALYAGTTAELRRWDGTSWTVLAAGGPVLSFDVLELGGREGLYLGGSFTVPGDEYLARWVACDRFPAFCDASDGALASCPCAQGNPDSGCDLPQGTGGVRLDVLAQSTSPNGATLRGTGFNPAGSTSAIVIRSDSLDPLSPVVFGDGLRCVNSSPLVRLAAAPALGGVSTHVLGHGAMAGAGTFYYQLWFRSNPSTYCDAGAAFNLSSGRALTW